MKPSKVLQRCLDDVILLEKWNHATLEIPTDLRKRQMREPSLTIDGR